MAEHLHSGAAHCFECDPHLFSEEEYDAHVQRLAARLADKIMTEPEHGREGGPASDWDIARDTVADKDIARANRRNENAGPFAEARERQQWRSS